MTDKSKELKTTIQLLNKKLHFTGIVEGVEPVSIDYTPPLGDNLGYTSLELLLLSFSSCVGSSVLVFLRKMKKTITGLEVRANGKRKEEHPTGFHTIILDLILTSADTSPEEFDKVLQLSEETYCPVWSMLKGNVDIFINYQLIIG
jgi:putative redox protein